MTRLAEGGVPDEVYDTAAREFSEAELAGLILAITGINAWNRIAVTTRMEPGHYRPGSAKQS
jgi:alkylhydroperoxidase family enzyme